MTWVEKNHIGMGPGLIGGLILLIVSIALAYACLKLYDEPVRAWLKAKWGRVTAK
jgi:peptidoglycan/LPS O-acetylase OafA/YrhL